MHRYASVQSSKRAPTVLRSRPVPRARPARCPPALRSQQPETSTPRPWCARGAQVLPHVLPGILSLSGPRESIPGPGLPETNAKLVARRDGRLAYYTQRRAGVPRNSSGGPPPGRAARPGDSSRAEETPPPDAARRFRDASAAGAVPAICITGLATYPSSTSRSRENDTDRRVRHVDGGGCFAAAEGESTPLATSRASRAAVLRRCARSTSRR